MNLYLRLLLLRIRTRQAARIGLWDTAVTRFRVAPTDLDLLGHMNNGKYLSLMDIGRLDLMVRSGYWAAISARGWYPVVAGQTISYRRSLRLGQRFEVHTRTLGFDDRWAYMEQRFLVGDVLYADAVVRARFLRRSGGSVSHEELEEAAGGFPEARHVPEWVREWTRTSSAHGKNPTGPPA